MDKPIIEVGDIVRNDGAKRAFCKLGTIVKLFTGADGHTRGAKVEVSTGKEDKTYLHRPLQHLVPLEVNSKTLDKRSSLLNMATQSICLDREALLNVMQAAAVEGNEQLSSLLSHLSPNFTKIVNREVSVGISTAANNEAFNSIVSSEFDKESFLIQLRKCPSIWDKKYPSIWDKKHPDYKQRNVKTNAWKQLALLFNKDGEYHFRPLNDSK